MATEPGHIQISEFSRDVIPSINWMMEDLFCQYGVSIPYFMLDYDFPDYSQRPEWLEPTFLNQWPTQWSGYNFNLDWGPWGYWLPWFNELLGLIFDEAHLPRLTLSDLSLPSVTMFNEYMNILYDNVQRHYVYGQSGTFTKDEIIEGEDSEVTGYYKWKDSDGYIHVANKSAADFEEEKIVGQTSGAYAYTYVGYPQTFDPVASYAIRRDVQDQPDYSTAKQEYQDDPRWTVFDPVSHNIVMWMAFGNTVTDDYIIRAYQCYYSYDTRVTPTLSSAKFVIPVTLVRNRPDETGDDPILYIYKYDFGDSVDADDWTGGTKIAERTFTVSDNETDVEIAIDTSHISVGDYSRFRFVLKRTENENFWLEPEVSLWALEHSIQGTSGDEITLIIN